MRVAGRAMISAARSSRMRSWRAMDSLEVMEERGHSAPVHVEHRWSIDPGLRAAMEALPERARTIVLLVCVDDYSYDEVADLLGMQLGTVKWDSSSFGGDSGPLAGG
jgi:DNA-directed RNA polymerase specialized sigma24 family protein